MSMRRNVRIEKSKPSRSQPRNAAKNARHCVGVTSRRRTDARPSTPAAVVGSRDRTSDATSILRTHAQACARICACMHQHKDAFQIFRISVARAERTRHPAVAGLFSPKAHVLDLTEDQQLVQRTMREFVAREVMPVASTLEHADEYPHALVERLKELGVFG